MARVAGPASAGAASAFDYYADLADTYPFEEPAQPSLGGKFGLIVREPVGVVGAIIPWNAPLSGLSPSATSPSPESVVTANSDSDKIISNAPVLTPRTGAFDVSGDQSHLNGL